MIVKSGEPKDHRQSKPKGCYPHGKTNDPDFMSNENQSEPQANRLIHESSPYLQQHARNPVDWYPWGDEALARARDENRMIFLSIGYSSCHWCHVMERESFEDPHTARLLNKHFVNIKVDREERPDVDAVYMEALQMMTGQGGWPLNVWLTPDQTPIFAGTYFPPQDYHGRPGFSTVIRRLVEVFNNNPDKVTEQAAEMRKALNNDLYDRLSPSGITTEQLNRAYNAYAESYDEEFGGFSDAPKFPMPMGIEYLLRYSHQPGSQSARTMAANSLEKMICGGIYDQVGGGFHRYSTDRRWLVPHFEKMLYDNALLIPAMASAAQITGKPLFREAVTETITFLNREMRHPGGAYYSALDADTDGVEGKYYTFTYDELHDLLDPDTFSLTADRFGVEPGGNWEGATILNRVTSIETLAKRFGTESEQIRRKLESAKSQLLEHRNKRTRPGLDDKIITSWNGLMLIALCQATRVLGHPPDDAIALGNFLADYALQGDTLYRIVDRECNAKQPGFLDDYALLADGFSHLFEITGDPRRLNDAIHLAELMLHYFHDEKKAAFHYTARNQSPLVSETRDIFDNAQPGGSTAAITALFRIGHLAGRPGWIRTAISAMEPLSELAASHAPAFGYLLQTMHRHCYPGNEIVIVSKPDSDPADDTVAREMIAIWRENFDPSSYLVLISGNESFAGSGFESLYGDKTARNGQTTAYICRDFQCKAPVQSADAFRKKMAESR